MMTQNNGQSLNLRRDGDLTYYNGLEDRELGAFLQRAEERVYSYAGDVMDGWLGMADQFSQAKTRLRYRRDPSWSGWVEARFAGFIGLDTADRLADLGERSLEERMELRSTIFTSGTGIRAIATYLSAPSEIQAKVKSGEVKATGADILRAVKEAEEAKKRAEDAEYRARQAMAALEERIESVRSELERQNELALRDATARLTREVDEARHQAELRQRDTEEAQRQVQRAQAEWDSRLKDATNKATEQERARLERDYTAQMQALEKQLEAQRQAARRAERDVNALTARLENARDSEAVRARWGMLAATMVKMLDGWIAEYPTAADAQYFEAHERTLTESVIKRLQVVLSRTTELSRSSTTIIDAG
jgi:hypothetical protein